MVSCVSASCGGRSSALTFPLVCLPQARLLRLHRASRPFCSAYPRADLVRRTSKPGAVTQHVDSSFGMQRTEIVCTACGGHLGHLFVSFKNCSRAVNLVDTASMAKIERRKTDRLFSVSSRRARGSPTPRTSELVSSELRRRALPSEPCLLTSHFQQLRVDPLQRGGKS